MARRVVDSIRHRLRREYVNVEGEKTVAEVTVDSLLKRRSYKRRHRVIVRIKR